MNPKEMCCRLRGLLATAVVCAIAGMTMSAPAAAAPVSPSVRENTELHQGWRFQFGDVGGAHEKSFDDSAWQQVRVPHTWNRIGFYQG